MKIARLRFALALGCVALLVGASGSLESDPHGREELEVVPVADGIYHLRSSRGGNVGVSIGEDGILLVDDLFPDTVGDVEEAVGSLAKGAPVYLINTHWHGDHTGGNAHFGRQATILAHENVRRRLAGDESIGGSVSQEELAGSALPEITYSREATLRFNGEAIRLIHLGEGAHTDGDTIVWFTDSKVVHMGDLYFEAGYPYIDTNSGGDVRGIIAAVKYVLATVPAEAKLVPGHGRVTGTGELRAYLEMLESVTLRVEELLAEEFTVEEMIAAEVTRDFDERWGRSRSVTPERFVRAVVASLQRD